MKKEFRDIDGDILMIEDDVTMSNVNDYPIRGLWLSLKQDDVEIEIFFDNDTVEAIRNTLSYYLLTGDL